MRMSIVCQLTGILQVLTSPIKLAMPFQCNAMDNYDIIVHIQRCAWKIEIHQSINNNTQAHSHGTDADGAFRGAPHTRAHSRSDKIKSSARGSEPTRRAELIALFKCNAPCSTSVNCCRVLVCLLGRTTAVYAGLHKYIVCTCGHAHTKCTRAQYGERKKFPYILRLGEKYAFYKHHFQSDMRTSYAPHSREAHRE